MNIILHRQEQVVLLSGPEAPRARSLARALGGRFIRSLNGYALTPAKADRWQLLFDHGLTAARGYRYGPGWWFLAPDGQRFNPYTVMEYIKPRIRK